MSPAARRFLPAFALCLLATLLHAPATSAQPLPKGYVSDDRAAPTETAASQQLDTWGSGSPDGALRPKPQLEVQAVQADEDASADVVDEEYADTDPSALTDFNQPLTPYGTWIDDPTYGTIWVPSEAAVGPDFAPYVTSGHWALTDEGDWIWVSDYTWGYIPFHYGRWIWIPAYGWSWIPGRVYAPAWVVWRVGDDGYIGWAPMPPAYYWSSGVAVSFWVVPPAAYVFCSTTYVFHHHVHTYVVHDRATVRRAAAHTHQYRPARPTGHAPAQAGGSAASKIGRHGYRPASPSLADAHVPSSSAPKAKVTPDPRSLAFAHKGASANARTRGRAAAPSLGHAPKAAPRPGPSRVGRHHTPRGFTVPRGRQPSFTQPGRPPRRGDRRWGVPAPRSNAPVFRTPGVKPPRKSVPSPSRRVTPAPRSHVTPHAPRSHATPSAPRRSRPSSTRAPRVKAPASRKAPSRAPSIKPSKRRRK